MAVTQRTQRVCLIAGCEQDMKRSVRGMCSMHYQRVLKDGSPGEAGPRLIPAEVRDGRKLCRGCHVEKVLADFHRSNDNTHGVSHYCKACGAQRTQRARSVDPESYRAKRRADYQRNRERYREASRAKYRRDPVRSKLAWWRAQGIEITEDGYYRLHSTQQGRCAICGKPEAANGKALAVDHDHATGRVRGLLCDDCNIALGRLHDSPDILRRAIQYLGM